MSARRSDGRVNEQASNTLVKFLNLETNHQKVILSFTLTQSPTGHTFPSSSWPHGVAENSFPPEAIRGYTTHFP